MSSSSHIGPKNRRKKPKGYKDKWYEEGTEEKFDEDKKVGESEDEGEEKNQREKTHRGK